MRKIGVILRKLGVGIMEHIDELSTANELIVIDSPNEIYKSNRLIESSYRLTTAQNRLLYMAMSKLKKIIIDKNMNIKQVEDAINSAKFETIYIDVIEYKKKFNIKANNLYTELAQVADDLFGEEVIYFDSSTNEITRARWVSTCKYSPSKKAIGFLFNAELIKDLLIFKSQYTRMLLDNFINIKSKYSFRIYELCKQYLKIGVRDLNIEDLRFKLCIADDEYKAYSDLKRQVIKPSINEINKNTDIEIALEEIEKDKKTRKVKKIRFYIKNNINFRVKIDNKPYKQLGFLDRDLNVMSEDISIVERLSDLLNMTLTAGTSESILASALEGIDEYKLKTGVIDYIKEKKLICDEYSRFNKVNNYIGLLIKALKGNWSRLVTTPKVENYEEKTVEGMNMSEVIKILSNNQ